MPTTATVDIGTLIVSTPGIVGGSPRIAGTRISVMHIAEWYNAGLSAPEMAELLPSLDLAGVYAAITFYLANKAAVDEEIAEGDRFIESVLADPASRTHRLTHE